LVYPDKPIRGRVLKDKALTEFVKLAMMSRAAKSEPAKYVKTAAGQHRISGWDLKKVSLALPHLDDQLKDP
jgi:hypothetical protein